MSANTPWSVKGIDAKAREVAKDLARRSGMTLGEWLNQMILEGEDVGAMISRERERSQRPAAARAPYRDIHPAYDDDADDYDRPSRVRPPYRDVPRRSAPFSSAAQPLSAREAASREPRRSIFEGRPRFETYEDEAYATASDDLGRVARALETLGSRIESSEGRSANAVRGVSHAVESLLGRLERSEQAHSETQSRLDEQAREVMDSVARVTRAEDDRTALDARLSQAERLIDAQAERLEGLSGHVREERERIARIEDQAKGSQTIETVRAVEGALGRLANQLYEGDARTRESLRDVREDMVGLSHRLAQIELRDPERVAQGVIDKVVTRLAQRLDAAEAQTTNAIKTLEQAFITMDKRLTAAEGHGDISDPETARSFRQLAADLSRRVEDSRAELKTALQEGLTAASDKFGTMEQAVGVVTARIADAEKRSAAAIETLGQDMVRVAEGLNRRVASAEAASQENVRRVTEAVESRFTRTETSHTQALERLGGEIARITERLNQRLAESERRTTQVLSGVGEQIEQQRDHVREDLSSRIRLSEERTAKMLDEARTRIDQRLAQVQTQTLLSETLARAPQAPARDADELPNPFGHRPEPAQAAARPAPEPEPEPEIEEEEVDLTGQLLAPVTDFKPEFDPFEDENDGFEDELTEAAPAAETASRDRFSGHVTPMDEDDGDSDPFADLDTSRKTAPPAREPRSASSFAARPPRPPVARGPGFDTPAPDEGLIFEDEAPTSLSVSTRDALAAARAAVRAASLESDDLGALKPGVSRTRQAKAPMSKPAKGQGDVVANTLKASGIAVVATGLLVGGALIAYKSLAPAGGRMDKATPLAAAVIDVTSPAADDNNSTLQANLKAQYDMAAQALDTHQPGALEKIKVVANQGYAPAEFRLGGVYSGEGGLVKPDKAQARLWTQRAAEGGVAKAMHNLALMYYGGDGGSQDRVIAAMWYRKAAERGIEDSQYNLGILYQEGVGVAMNLSESYKWLSIAAKSGDADAAKAAAAVRTQLSDAQIQKVDGEVASFMPISDGQPPMAASASQG